jgi:proteic killer suppression protein
MIESFQHKGLRQLFETDSTKGVNAEHPRKLRQILGVLACCGNHRGATLAYFRIARAERQFEGLLGVTVRANWRVIFRFEDGKASDVDLVDYH